MRWFRVYTEIMDDPKIAKMSGDCFKVFIFVLAIASEQENDGKIDMDLMDIKWRIRMPNDVVETAFNYLIENNIIGIDEENNYFVTNWDKRQFKSDDVNQRVTKHRKKSETLHDVNDETLHTSESETLENRTEQIRTEQKYTTSFLTFWKHYPKKIGKDAAWKTWVKLNGTLPGIDSLTKAIEEQKRSDQWLKDNGQFIPHPSTWLNQGRWKDELEVKKSKWD